MVAPRKEGFGKDERAEGLDRTDRSIRGDNSSDQSREVYGSESSGRRISGGLTERLRDVFRDEANEDLLLDRGDVENGFMQWIRALDLQILGACRADERLKPLVKLNVSSGGTEDRLMTQLCQHFEASEVGMLARCLCIPLVSVRVGKVEKQGSLLCPTATRGHLNLTLLPSSNMRLSFTGDDGCIERLALVSNEFESSPVVIEEISADSSGRSFLLKLPQSQVSYFWCSEKSRVHGMELLAKMKDLVQRKPSLSHLTGICESRLESFATQLRVYLLASSTRTETDSSSLSSRPPMTASAFHASDPGFSSPSLVSKSSRFRLAAFNTTRGHPFYQGSLSPRSNTFKDGIPRSSSSVRNGVKEKLRRRGDDSHSSLLSKSQENASVPNASACSTSLGRDDNIGGNGSCGFVPFCLPSPLTSFDPLSLSRSSPQLDVSSALFSPYYCWCPPCPASLQYTINPSTLPISYEESLPLPPLSTLLSAAVPPVSLVTSELPFDVDKLPALSLPSIFPEPLVRLPLPVSSVVTLPSSPQIPTFVPFMSDPIVHIPIIDVCSSGQGYLVSAGPAISSVIPPLLPGLVNHPLIPSTESVVEKSARETLRMLMASTPTSASPKLMNVLPVVFSRMNESFPCGQVSKHGSVATAGSQGFYSGMLDIEAVARSVSSIGLPSSRGEVDDGCSAKRGKVERKNHSGGIEEDQQALPVSSGRDFSKEDGLSSD